MKTLSEIFVNCCAVKRNSNIDDIENFVRELGSDYLIISFLQLSKVEEAVCVDPFDSVKIELIKQALGEYASDLWSEHRESKHINISYNYDIQKIEIKIGQWKRK